MTRSKSILRKKAQRLSSSLLAIKADTNSSASVDRSLLDAATSVDQVSAFCRAVMSSIIPNEMLGSGVEGKENSRTMMRYVDRFVRLRRFENWNLHNVCQSLKVNPSSIDFLISVL